MRLSIITSFFMGYALCDSQEADKPPSQVVTPLGSIEGYWKTSYGGRRYKAFEGIPFAQPPTGEFRFSEARPVLPWNGTLMAKQFGSTCLQYIPNPGEGPPGFVSGTEDCLFLNIYTAITDDDQSCRKGSVKTRSELLPVIFFVHGGSFQSRAGSQFGEKYLLDHDVMYISINYRLGPLGFLSTEDNIVPGNMGLKDQVMALRWVKDNIQFFGGNPSRITIIGESSGAASVHYLILSKLTTGLFQRAMSVSGTALNCWAQVENPLEKAKKLAAIVGCPSDEVHLMIDCLKIRPADQITNATGEFMPYLGAPLVPFGPVVEKGGKFTLIDRPPIDIIISGEDSQDVPWITSNVSEEGLAVLAAIAGNPKGLEELNNNWETIAPYMLDYNYTIPKSDHARIARLIKQHYLGSQPIDKSTLSLSVQLGSDRGFLYDTEKAARLQAQANRSPVRFYYFSYRGAHSVTEIASGSRENFGVSHADDVQYVLDADFDPTTTENDRRMQKLMIRLWVSYATNGVPDVGTEWTEVSQSSEDDLRYLHIAGPDQIGMESSSNYGDKHFWRTIPFNENIPTPKLMSSCK